MRISTLQTFNQSLAQMQKGQAELARIQEQVASGKQILRPSDDPVAAARVLELELELARFEKFEDNIEDANRRLQLEEITMDQIKTATDRARELTLQAANGTLSNADRATVAAELRQLQGNIQGLMNTKSASGEYLFGGSRGFLEPYEKQSDGSFEYRGDDGQRFIQVGSNLKVASTDSGQSVFNVIPDDIAVNALGASAGAMSISVTDPEVDEFRDFADQYGDVTIQITGISAGPPQTYDYEIFDSAGTSITGPGATTATVGTPVEFGGLTFDYTGGFPAAAADLDPITLKAEQGRHSVLTTLEELASLLEQPVSDKASRDALADGVAEALDELSLSAERLIGAQAQLGARMNVLESAAESNADIKLFTETNLSSLEDLDYAEAITRFSMQETALQAAQQTFARVSGLTLFNYL